MTSEIARLQFRVLYRQFLFRMADMELLSPQMDLSKLLGQFAALLIFVSIGFTISLNSVDGRLSRDAILISAWRVEHSLIAATMLVVGLFSVLSWDSAFLDRRDVMVLGPLPVRARTLFLARAAASATALSLTVISLNALPGLAFPLAAMPQSTTIFELFFSPAAYRMFFAYWITMMAAGSFIFCGVLALQGLAAQTLPRRKFLKVSACLQMAAFCLFVSVYFLQPSLASPQALSAPDNQSALAWLPSYWFLGLFQQLNGSMHEVMVPLARRAWFGLALIILATGVVYMLSYFRTLRKIIEEPDITAGSRGWIELPSFGDSLTTAIVHFSARTLMRSRQHRVTIAFYLGLGFAIAILFMGTPAARQALRAANVPMLFSSLVMMCVAVVGTRVVFSIPIALPANWVFRVTEVQPCARYKGAIRCPLFVLAVAPVWVVSSVAFFSIWPWPLALGHLLVLAIWGSILGWISLYRFQKIPFTCSWLPGKSSVHMAFLGALGLLFLMTKFAALEQRVLEDLPSFGKFVAGFGALAILIRWFTLAADHPEVQFVEEPAPALIGLGLRRDGVLPISFTREV